jgi:hypothetical protein
MRQGRNASRQSKTGSLLEKIPLSFHPFFFDKSEKSNVRERRCLGAET